MHDKDMFDSMLLETVSESNDGLYDFCRKHVLHGTPYVFHQREMEYYEFRKKIANNFHVSFHEVYITGSAKFGFSPFKNKVFDLDSDIDVAIISPDLFENIMWKINKFQFDYRASRHHLSYSDLKLYRKFLEYVAIGWIRPDKLPLSYQMKNLKDDWFDFFKSLSNGKSEVGNYPVNGGVFKTYQHYECYSVNGLLELRNKLSIFKKGSDL